VSKKGSGLVCDRCGAAVPAPPYSLRDGQCSFADSILLKHGALDDREMAVMRTHPEIGHTIWKDVPFMREAAQIVLCHEERFDGKGYPRGLAGDAIPFGAQLFAVIDTLDAITSDRPYRSGLPFDSAEAEIRRCSGELFHPKAVKAFLAEEAVLCDMVAAVRYGIAAVCDGAFRLVMHLFSAPGSDAWSVGPYLILVKLPRNH
jgi:hypothetical protein